MTALVAVVAAAVAAATVGAGSYIDTTPAPVNTAYLSAAVGYFDAFRDSNIPARNDSAADLRVEYNPLWVIYKRGIVTVTPVFGVEATTDGSAYGLGGLQADLQYHQWYLTPSFAAGLYWSGEGKNMGSPVEFRSQIETGYEFGNQSRLGVAVSHISNASLSNTNPGSEILSVYYHHPVNF